LYIITNARFYIDQLFLVASQQTPGRLRRGFCEAEQRFLLLFPEKEEYQLIPWGQAPKPPGSASPRFGLPTFCEAEHRFSHVFLGKEEYFAL
jgi:hypothetical protein